MVLVLAGHQRRDRAGVEDLAEQAGDREDDHREDGASDLPPAAEFDRAVLDRVASAWRRPTGTKTIAPSRSSNGAQPR